MFRSALRLLVAGVVAIPGSAAAADASFCSDYAETAAQEAALAGRFDCAFHGPKWTTDPEAHRQWCRSASKLAVRAEADARANDIRLCMCDWYADQATAQAHANAAHGCGFTGPRWSPDRSAHYRWCVLDKAPLAILESEVATRQELLAKCAPTDR